MVFSSVDGCIEHIGTGDVPDDILKLEAHEIIDLDQNIVLPGLHDAHTHALYTGESSNYLDLINCASIEELQQRLHVYSVSNPHLQWIIGFGWEQDALSESGLYPSKYDLDQVVSDRPVLLYRACWHIAVVNSKALEFSKFDLSKISKRCVDTDTNGLTGILREDV